MSVLVGSYISIRCVAGKDADDNIVQVDLYGTEDYSIHSLLIFAMAQNDDLRRAVIATVEKWDTPEMQSILNDAGL